MTKHWIWKSVAAGLCGSAAHSALMFLKSWTGALPSFQPYDSLQNILSQFIGSELHPIVPWVFSFLSGATFVGFLFGLSYQVLPSKNGATKGFVFGILGWMMMGLLFFPFLGLGFFGLKVGIGLAPALFSLAMLLTYSVVMGLVYSALNS